MKPRKHLLATFSVLLIAALLVACVAPAVAPPPSPTPAPPTPTPDLIAPVKAWVDAINKGDVDAALALITEAASGLDVMRVVRAQQEPGRSRCVLGSTIWSAWRRSCRSRSASPKVIEWHAVCPW